MKINGLKHTYPNGRASGKTFRRIMQGLELASSGNIVFYILENRNMKDWTTNKINDVVHSYFHCNTEAGRRHTIEFPNGGELRVVTDAEYNNPRKDHNGYNKTINVIWDLS